MTAREVPEPSYSDPKTNQQKTALPTYFQNRMRLRIIFHLVLGKKYGKYRIRSNPPLCLFCDTRQPLWVLAQPGKMEENGFKITCNSSEHPPRCSCIKGYYLQPCVLLLLWCKLLGFTLQCKLCKITANTIGVVFFVKTCLQKIRKNFDGNLHPLLLPDDKQISRMVGWFLSLWFPKCLNVTSKEKRSTPFQKRIHNPKHIVRFVHKKQCGHF